MELRVGFSDWASRDDNLRQAVEGGSSTGRPKTIDVIHHPRYPHTYYSNGTTRISTPVWIGRDLERLRKLRGLRREDVAAQLSLSPSTIRNIEHDETYNVSLDLLRQVAEVLGATVRISIEVPKSNGSQDDGSLLPDASLFADSSAAGAATSPHADAAEPEDRHVVTNERFIRRVRERYPECPLTNSQIGRRMWQFAHSRGAVLMKGRKQLRPSLSPSIVSYRVPTTSAEYAVRQSDMASLDRFADRLGRAFKDDRGRVLVPVK
ncbi:MAG: helix-turn-helix domain-containing protein [Gemmatimonadaceae bacterium]